MSLSALVSVYPLIKLPFLLSGSFAFYVSSTPPNPAPSKEETKRYKGDVLKRGSPWLIVGMCVIRFYLLNNMAESAVVLAHTFPSHPLSNSVLRTLTVSPTSASPHLPPSWLAGFTLLTLGSVLRYASYCYLGTLYTFRLSIRDAHHLVTSGPYAHVRHPGYLGAILTLAGVGTCTFGPGSLLHDGGWLATRAGAALGATLVLGMGMMVRMVVARVPVEDAVLRREFGQEWERWARRVPYALIPGIY